MRCVLSYGVALIEYTFEALTNAFGVCTHYLSHGHICTSAFLSREKERHRTAPSMG